MKKLLSLLTIISLSAGSIYAQETKIEKPQTTESATVTNGPDLMPLIKQNAADAIGGVKDIVIWAKEAAQTTGNFTKEQTPLFLKEYIAWIFWSNLIWSVTFTIPAILFPILSFISLRRVKGWVEPSSYNKDKSDRYWSIYNFLFIIFTAISVIFEVVFINTVPDKIQLAVKATVAPRVVIVEKISELVK